MPPCVFKCICFESFKNAIYVAMSHLKHKRLFEVFLKKEASWITAVRREKCQFADLPLQVMETIACNENQNGGAFALKTLTL